MKKLLFASCLVVLNAGIRAQNEIKNPQHAPEDWEKTEILTDDASAQNLVKIGIVTAKASGTTTLSSVSRVTVRATNKLKMAASLFGGNKVRLNFTHVEGNIFMLRTARAQFIGTVYTDNPIYPEAVSAVIKEGEKWQVANQFRLANNAAKIKSRIMKRSEAMIIEKIEPYENAVWLTGNFRNKSARYRITYLSEKRVVLFYQKGARLYNLILLRA
jgi:hypothetical protein